MEEESNKNDVSTLALTVSSNDDSKLGVNSKNIKKRKKIKKTTKTNEAPAYVITNPKVGNLS